MKGAESRGTQLTGRALTIARLVWVTLTLLVAGLYIWALRLGDLSGDDISFNILMPLGYFAIDRRFYRRK